jgi:hypothetical protein
MVHYKRPFIIKKKGQVMSNRKIAIAIGVLFVVQMVTAIIGNSLIEAFVGGGSNKSALTIGVLLMVSSGVSVVGIGLLAYRVLKDSSKLAIWYPAMRIAELAVSTACGIYLLATLQVVSNQMLLVYIPTAIGGLVFTYLLFTSRLVPRFIAVLGLVGYAALSLGTLLDFMGVVDLNAGSGMILLAPGGLFEVLVLPVWLIAKGFKQTAMVARES